MKVADDAAVAATEVIVEKLEAGQASRELIRDAIRLAIEYAVNEDRLKRGAASQRPSKN
jgi:hypothetical protein